MKREKQFILAARIVSMVFTPFYLPFMGMVILFVFSYLSLFPWAYKLQVLCMVYLFTILFLMFDVETVFLYPWAVVVKDFGEMALLSIGFFLLVLVLGLAYAWRKGALEWK